ncbi:folylpolyglutamate synthase/dihydrofolate synthase family protein [Sporolactobacillus sp. Y61]|uniref:tetrahydrofolate synthase n=1 Tax=Sporolactobacillus sp. Y61 TaxID=3160863 RepID=A0AAU8IEI0_9BACL
MFKSAEEALSWIHGLNNEPGKPGTERMKWMLDRMRHPEHRLRSVHVGGTNGKGSTVCFLWHIYQEEGLKVGTFTSPYITSFNERMMVNGEAISDDDLVRAANIVYPVVKEAAHETNLGRPSEFEVVTLISFVYFGRMNPCDLVLYEVGLGGRLDPTNVIFPLVSIITNVGMDHMQQLGDTLEKIAKEKAGIIKHGVGVITTVENPQVLSVLRRTAKAEQANIYVIGDEFRVQSAGHDEAGEHFDFDSLYIHEKDLMIRMKGQYQLKNAAAALMAVDFLQSFFGLTPEKESIRNGLRKAVWPGRFETVSRDPLIILDGAHNLQGTEALVQTVKRYYPGRKIHVLYAVMKDKEYSRMIPRIESIAADMTFTTIASSRAAHSHDLYEVSSHTRKRENRSWQTALEKLISETQDRDVLLACGSLYFIAQIRRYIYRHHKDLQLHLN